ASRGRWRKRGSRASTQTGRTIPRAAGQRETTMLRRTLRRSSLATGILISLALCAQAQERQFDLPAGSARHSIPEFARQASVQIVAPGDRLADQRTAPLQGTFDTRVALARLLSDTDLRVARDDGRTITLTAASAAGAAADAQPAPQEPAAEEPP